MAKRRKHWTQTQAGRRRMSAMIRASYQRRRAAAAAAGGYNGQGPAPKPARGRAIAKDEINALAKAGARTRIAQLESELTKLRMFVGGDE